MQIIIVEFALAIVLSLIIGLFASMVGISGGAFKTPLLIIVFGLGAQLSASISLLTALFMAIVSTYSYHRNRPQSILYRTGLILAMMTVPGSIVGSMLKSFIADDYILRIVFGICLFPIAVKMLYSHPVQKRVESADAVFHFGDLEASRKILSLVGGFTSGIAAGLLGIGGGSILVPLMCIVMGLPVLIAAATSVFTMLFTTVAGTAANVILMAPLDFERFIIFSAAVGLGVVVGGHFGPMFACRIDAIHLRRFFGIALIFPIVKMMEFGKLLLDPAGLNYAMEILGDIMIWLAIVIPIGLLRLYQATGEEEEEECGIHLPD